MYILHEMYICTYCMDPPGASRSLVSVEVVDPRIPVGALLLARGELPLVAPMLQVALVLLPATPARPVRVVAVEHAGGVNLRKWFRESCPSNNLLRSNEVDVGEGENGVHKVEESLLTVIAVKEPSRVEK